MDPHEYIRSVIKATNAPGSTLDFRGAAVGGLKRMNPHLCELLPLHYTSGNVSDTDIRDWILENWSETDAQSQRT